MPLLKKYKGNNIRRLAVAVVRHNGAFNSESDPSVCWAEMLINDQLYLGRSMSPHKVTNIVVSTANILASESIDRLEQSNTHPPETTWLNPYTSGDYSVMPKFTD